MKKIWDSFLFYFVAQILAIPFFPFILEASRAHDPDSGFPMEIIWQAIGFIILLILLIKFFKKPISASLKKRREEIKIFLDELRHKKKEVEDQLVEWEKKISLLDQEIAELHQKIIAEGEIERQRIIAHAQEEGEHIKRQAQIVAEQELIKALLELKKETVNLAASLAHDLLKKVFQPNDQERLVKEFIKQLEANP